MTVITVVIGIVFFIVWIPIKITVMEERIKALEDHIKKILHRLD